MSEKIVEGKRRKFLSEKPNSDDPVLETQFSESIEDILEQEFKKIKDIPGVDTIKLFWGHRPRGKKATLFRLFLQVFIGYVIMTLFHSTGKNVEA